MNLKTKAIILLLSVSLVPLFFVGSIAFNYSENIIETTLGASFHQVAHDAISMIDQNLYNVYQDIRAWTELEIMQDVIIKDIDGRISTFLMSINSEYKNFANIYVINQSGEIVAASRANIIGMDFSKYNFFKTAINGEYLVSDVNFDDISKEWIVRFSFPIRSHLGVGGGEVVGLLCVDWKASELSNILQYKKKESDKERYEHVIYDHIMLIRNDGLIISAPDNERHNLFKENLVTLGMKSAQLAVTKHEGEMVETDEHNVKSLTAYDYSRGYKDFKGLGWAVIVLQDAKKVYAPLNHLKLVVLVISLIAIIAVFFITILISRKMTDPILNISKAAGRIAEGNLDERIDYVSSDELGILSNAFNKMIGDLKSSREEILNSKQFIDNIIASMINMLIVVKPDRSIVLVNQSACDLLGYSEEELKGQSLDRIVSILKEQDDKAKRLEDILAKGPINNIEKTFITKSGREIPVLFSASVLFSESGIQGIVIVAQDITERKKAEKTLLEKQAQLTHAGRLTSLGEMATGVAHELNQPLAIIRSDIQGLDLSLKYNTFKPENVPKVAQRIIKQVDRASKIITHMRGFARAESTISEPIDIAEPINAALQFFNEQFRFHSVNIKLDFEENLPKVKLNSQHIEQIVVNLLSNARYALDKKGKNSGKDYKKEIVIRLFMDKEKQSIILSIKDNGIGMTPEVASRCFEPFYTTKDVGEGTGLGLSIIYGIVKEFGSISVKSADGVGTEFIMSIILKDEKGVT
jgi:PAS domain S-box-containing protein